jgi:hypothetical protein
MLEYLPFRDFPTSPAKAAPDLDGVVRDDRKWAERECSDRWAGAGQRSVTADHRQGPFGRATAKRTKRARIEEEMIAASVTPQKKSGGRLKVEKRETDSDNAGTMALRKTRAGKREALMDGQVMRRQRRSKDEMKELLEKAD